MRLDELISAHAPLHVDEWEDNLPFFAIAGAEPDWALSVMCPFLLRVAGEAPLDSEEASFEAAASAVARLQGKSLIAVDAEDDRVDPTFLFDDGSWLTIRADTDLDPWGLRLYRRTPKMIDVMGRMAGAAGS